MFLSGYVDFSGILAGRSILPGASVGSITKYHVGGTEYTPPVGSLSMTFDATKGSFSTNGLPYVLDDCLSAIEFYAEITTTTGVDLSITGEAAAEQLVGGSMTYSYDNCS